MPSTENRNKAIHALVAGILLLMAPLCFSAERTASHSGYIQNVEVERQEKIVEMVLVPKPHKQGRSLDQIIFEGKLRQEFQYKYENRFGRTEAERNFTDGRFFEHGDRFAKGSLEDVREEERQKREYGEFMMKRLAEHHIDDYARSSPSIRPAYEMKERISNVNVEVKKGYKMRMRYSYSGNYMMVRMENPYDIDTRITFQMEESGIGPSSINETIYNLSYPYSPALTISSYYEQVKGEVSLVGQRTLAPGLVATLTGKTDLVDKEQSTWGDLVLVGLTWTN